MVENLRLEKFENLVIIQNKINSLKKYFNNIILKDYDFEVVF